MAQREGAGQSHREGAPLRGRDELPAHSAGALGSLARETAEETPVPAEKLAANSLKSFQSVAAMEVPEKVPTQYGEV